MNTCEDCGKPVKDDELCVIGDTFVCCDCFTKSAPEVFEVEVG